MNERARALNGTLEHRARITNGTCMSLEFQPINLFLQKENKIAHAA